jgi:hypothetical protein
MLIWSAIGTWPKRIVPGGTFRTLGAAVKEAYSGSGHWQTYNSFCSALEVGGDSGTRMPCDSSGYSSVPDRRGRCVKLSQVQVRSLGHVGTGILGIERCQKRMF